MSTDAIHKQVLLRATRERVWRAISDSKEFGHWFGVKFEGPFPAGATVKGVITPTKVDAVVAESQKPHEGTAFEIEVETIEPEHKLSFRWHPYGCPSDAPTLVTFTLEDADDGVLLIVTESGFDQIPIERRAKAFEMNEGGWAAQMTLIEKYLALEG